MLELSPSTKAVLEAYWTEADRLNRDVGCNEILVAALRSAANQNCEFEVPFSVIDDWEKIKGSCTSFYAAAKWGYSQALKEILAIAVELEREAQ